MDQDPMIQEWIGTYDEVGAEYDTAQPLDVLRKETVERIRHKIATGTLPEPKLDLEEYLAAQFAAHVLPERDRRSRTLTKEIEYLLDAAFSEQGAYVDPLLSQVHRLGNGDDKRLRLWTQEDWHQWAYRRLQGAAETSRKASQADELAGRLIDVLEARGAMYTGDLFS